MGNAFKAFFEYIEHKSLKGFRTFFQPERLFYTRHTYI